MLAVRLRFVAADESIVWETVKGFALVEAAPADRRTASIRGWFESAVRRQAATLAAASINAHEADLASLQRELHAALKPLIVRERGIVERLCGGHARLAAPLVQQGLFDRRAVRDAEARRRVMEEAAARAESRIRTLERQLAADLGDRSLIFAVTWAR